MKRCWWFFHDWSQWGDPLFVNVVDHDTQSTSKVLAIQTSTCARCKAMRYRQRVKWNVYGNDSD